MTPDNHNTNQGTSTVMLDRHLVTCRQCGWVHYVMTPEEKATNDRFLERYQLNEKERWVYESAFRQCLRCESPASDFRSANAGDLQRAASHIVTPVLMEAAVTLH